MVYHNMNLGPTISDSSVIRSVLSGSENCLNVAHANCQSINPSTMSVKLDELRNILIDSHLHILGVSETWLKPEVTDRLAQIPGFTICRNDRPSGHAGGVCLYISNGLKFKKVYHTETYGSCEALFVEVFCQSSVILVGVVYNLPNSGLNPLETSLGDLFMKYENLVIMGDFNWNLFDPVKAASLRSLCNSLSLNYLHNSLPTYWDSGRGSTSLIDYFIISDLSKVRISNQVIVPALSHHALIYVSLSFTVECETKFIEYKDYNSVDHDLLGSYVDQFDFSTFYGNNCVNLKLNILNSLISDMHQFVPIVKFQSKPRVDPWMNKREVSVARKLRDSAYRSYIDNRSEENRRKFCKCRNKLKSTIRKFRRQHHMNIFNGTDNRKMWRLLNNSCLGRSSNCVSEVNVDEINNYFALYGAGVNSNTTTVSDFFVGLDGFSFDCINVDDLCIALTKVRSNAIGTDCFPIKFIKLIFPYISTHILHLFNMIITTSTFPDSWKFARVVPIPKKGNSYDNENLRPISILPSLSKVLEHVIKHQITQYILRHKLIRDFQYAFRDKFSTSAMLLGITESVRESLNDNKDAVLVSLDLSKAFDRLNHVVLIKKLKRNYGFSGMACKLIYSYLRERSQFVSLCGSNSSVVFLSSGVPQGSVIGPLLFLMYLEDCVECLDLHLVQPFLFADDIQLLFSSRREFPDVLEAVINFNLANLSNWMVSNDFVLNSDKTKAIMFRSIFRSVTYPNIRLGNQDVMFHSRLKCLGFVIDEYLNFGPQVDAVSAKVTLGLRTLYHCGLHLPLRVKRTIAHSLLMSHINYCFEVVVGTLSYNIDRLKRVLNRIVRFVFDLRHDDYDRLPSCVIMFLGCSFGQYIELRNMLFLYKTIKYGVPSYLASKFVFFKSSRITQIVYPRISNSLYERSFVVRTARIWNALPERLHNFTVSTDTFKNRLLINFLRSCYQRNL